MFLHFWEPLSKRNTLFLGNKAGWYYLRKTLIILLCFTFRQWLYVLNICKYCFCFKCLILWLYNILYLSFITCILRNWKVSEEEDDIFETINLMTCELLLFFVINVTKRMSKPHIDLGRLCVSNSGWRRQKNFR